MHPIRLLLLCLLVACSPARREAGRNVDAIRSIHFEGNGGALSGQNDLQLRQQMETEASRFGLSIWPLMYWVDPKVLDVDDLLRDSYRLETWYAHHGWFDAEVLGWEIRQLRERGKRRSGIVAIRGTVHPGRQSTVSDLQLTGLDKPRHKTLKAAWRRDASLRSGDPFDLSYAEADRALLEDLLFGVGFPHAHVELDVRADPANYSVDLALNADTGIHTRFGEVQILGADRVTEEQIRSRFTWERGKEYQVDRLRETEQALLDMGTFSSVRVQPDLRDPTLKDTPIRVNVTESRWRTLRIGLGTGLQTVGGDVFNNETGVYDFIVDGFAWSPRVIGSFKHANLFHQLIAWELRTSVGVYYEPAPERPEEPVGSDCAVSLIPGLSGVVDGDPNACPHLLEPTWSIGTSASWPRILGERWGLEGAIEFERDVFVGAFPYRGLETNLAAVYRPSRYFQIRIGPSVGRTTYLFDSPEQRRALVRVYGEGFERQYLRVAFDQQVIIDRRNQKRRTKVVRGWVYNAFGLRETLPLNESAQKFIGINADNRYLLPIPIGDDGYALEAAFAVRGSVLLPYTDQQVGYPERIFLGGANSVRGFRTNQVGPYDIVRNDDNTATYLPRGGTTMLSGSTEIRYPWAYGITWATFVDLGALSETVPEFGLDKLRWSAGAGFRYQTPVGPFRFDLSFRQLYPEDEGPERILNNNPRLGRPSDRTHDFFSSLYRDGGGPKLAMVFFIAIGESL